MYLSKKWAILAISISVLVFFLINNEIKSQDIQITDGDTIKIDGEKIRFSGIDAPELKQTCLKNNVIIFCGLEAKNLLIKIIDNNDVICVYEGKDQYRRTLAECFLGDLSLSSYLVRNGYAFAYRKYSKKYIQDEEFAKENKNGLWSTEFEYPWLWRKK